MAEIDDLDEILRMLSLHGTVHFAYNGKVYEIKEVVPKGTSEDEDE